MNCRNERSLNLRFFLVSLVLLSCVAFAQSAEAASPQAGGTKVTIGHLFQQPNASGAYSILTSMGAEQVNDYDIETVASVPAQAIAGLAHAAAARHLEFSVHDEYDIIEL